MKFPSLYVKLDSLAKQTGLNIPSVYRINKKDAKIALRELQTLKKNKRKN